LTERARHAALAQGVGEHAADRAWLGDPDLKHDVAPDWRLAKAFVALADPFVPRLKVRLLNGHPFPRHVIVTVAPLGNSLTTMRRSSEYLFLTNQLVLTGELIRTGGVSQASPMPSPSTSAWSTLAACRQLSLALGTPSASRSGTAQRIVRCLAVVKVKKSEPSRPTSCLPTGQLIGFSARPRVPPKPGAEVVAPLPSAARQRRASRSTKSPSRPSMPTRPRRRRRRSSRASLQ